MKKFDVTSARKAGYSDTDILGFMEQQQLAPKWDAGVVKNIPGSGVKFAKDIWSGITSLPSTVSQVAKGEVKVGDIAKGIGSEFKKRYLDPGALQRTAYFDPVGMMADASVVAGGAGAAAKGVGTVARAPGLVRAGRTLTQASRTAGPLINASKVAGKAAGATKGVLGKASDFVGNKATKFNKTNIEAIEKATGMSPIEYARKNNLPIAATQKSVSTLDTIIDGVRKEYKALVIQGKKVSRKDYAQALTKQAEDLLARADNPSTRSVANQLKAEAKLQIAKHKEGIPMTDELLAGTKSAGFEQATKAQIGDPMKSGVEEQIGRAGVEEIERLRPGSKALGKQQRGLIEYRDQLKKQAKTGQGTQLFNLFKPTGAGALMGAGVGSVVPGLGNVTGAVIGGTAAAIANSPQFLAFASNALNSASKLRLPAGATQLLEKIIDATRYGRVLTLTPQEQKTIKSIQESPEYPQSYDSIIPKNLFQRYQ
jgi:hypothetical protein